MSQNPVLTPEDIYVINQDVLGKEPLVISPHLLRVAVARPFTRMFGEEAYPRLVDKASALLHALAHDHLFMDGNKRTARLAVERFVEQYGATLTWDEEQAYNIVLDIAKGRYDVKQLAQQLTPFLKTNTD
jgi:death-on-curing protein